MILSVFSLISWIVICLFVLIPKGMSLVENIIVYLLLCMCSTMSGTLLTLNFNLLKTSDQLHVFFCYWMIRTITFPLAILGGINLFFYFKSKHMKALALILSLALALSIEMLSHKEGVVIFTGWNSFYFLILEFFVLILNLYTARLLRKIT